MLIRNVFWVEVRYMSLARCIQIIMLSYFISACKITSEYNPERTPPTLPTQLFETQQSAQIESVEDIFYLADETKRYVRHVTKHSETQQAQLTALVTSIFDNSNLSLIYQSNANTTAQQTFENRQANCLSLTIMTYAMLKELNLETSFQEVLIPEFWTTRAGNTLINRHVNLVSKASISNSKYFTKQNKITIDFNPLRRHSYLETVKLTKQQIVSFFYSNKGAEYLIKENYAMAYTYLKEALLADDSNQSAYLNIGVLLARNDLDSIAEEFYKYAIKLNPEYSSAYENLAILYNKSGNYELAEQLLADLHEQRLSNPYYHFMLGEKAARRADFERAIVHYNDAIKLNARLHEVYASMASAYYELDKKQQSRKALLKAKTASRDNRLAEKYSAKLELLF